MPTPFDQFGGEARVRELAERIYDAMEREPELLRLHALDAQGRVSRDSRDRFALFLIGWLGGPQHYMERHGHPRLRMRHGHLPVNLAMRDAWVRTMTVALDSLSVGGELRALLDQRFAEVADFLRNVEEG
jgi:hemoglobin